MRFVLLVEFWSSGFRTEMETQTVPEHLPPLLGAHAAVFVGAAGRTKVLRERVGIKGQGKMDKTKNGLEWTNLLSSTKWSPCR